jgi:sucrose-6-phosphate hydrolase SacC (GH32 family)
VSGLKNFREETNTMYYDRETGKLFIGTFRQGVHIYDMRTGKILRAGNTPENGNVTRICSYGDDFLLFAVEGVGIYKMDKDTYTLKEQFTQSVDYGIDFYELKTRGVVD